MLLYGDSFAACSTDKNECFQGLLNSDPLFSQKYFLLNYGVGGYGVDQIFLLYQKTIGQYKNPFVILSLLTEDLDRSVLSLRVGQKPFYRLIDNSLVLSGIPIDPSLESFVSKHPPDIKSYLLRMFIYSEMFRRFIQSEGRPWRLKNYFRTEPLRMRDQIEEINRHILLEIVQDLRKRRVDHLFLIFHPQWALTSDNDWRDAFLVRFLESNSVPYLTSKVMLQQHAKQPQASYEDYYIAGDGHLNGHANKIIADELKTYLLTGSPNSKRQADSSVGARAATVAAPLAKWKESASHAVPDAVKST